MDGQTASKQHGRAVSRKLQRRSTRRTKAFCRPALCLSERLRVNNILPRNDFL